jgi:hypothetical protein
VTSEPPPLPESDDPRELLGAEPGDDLVELRRRYVRLIKTYRAETHPREFARIRDAWEAVQASFRFYAAEQSYEAEHEVSQGHVAEEDPEARAALAASWGHVAAGRLDEARRALETWAASPGQAPRAWAHRYLLEELAEVPEPGRVWDAALERQVDVVPWMTALLDSSELRGAAGGLKVGWPRLRSSDDRGAARRVLRARLHDLLRAGRDEEALAEVEHPTFREDATGDEVLGGLAHEVASATAWSHPDRARALLDAFPSLDSDDALHDHARLALDAGEGHAPWASEFADLEPLHRFLRLGSIVEGDEALGLCQDLWIDFRRQPDRYLEAFERMPGPAATVYLGQVSGLCDRYEVEEPVEPDDLDRALREADSRSYPRGLSFLQNVLIYALLVGTAVSFWRWKWWGLLVLGGGFVVLVALKFVFDAWAYRKALRPALARYVIETGASPAAIDEWIGRTKKLENLDSMRSEIAKDDTIAAIHATTRLGDLLPKIQETLED